VQLFDPANGTFSLIVGVTLLGLLPFAALLLTSYIKISVVLFILRNALGLQQAPGNMVLASIAMILSIYLAMPLAHEVYAEARTSGLALKSLDDWEELGRRTAVPVKKFLMARTNEADREFFVSATANVWAGSKVTLERDSLMALVPAFVMHELTAAFKIGFLVYIPFLAVDLIVANVLMALGMMMMSPVVVSVPFKLLLFVMIDGWNVLIRNLILSYSVV